MKQDKKHVKDSKQKHIISWQEHMHNWTLGNI